MTKPHVLSSLFLLMALLTTPVLAGGKEKAKPEPTPVKKAFWQVFSHPKKEEPKKPSKKKGAVKGDRTPDVVQTVSVGRTVKNGKLVEAHNEKRVVQDAHWNMNLPEGPITQGPPNPLLPPNALPPSQSQRLTDSENDAQSAAAQLRRSVDDINVRGRELVDQNTELSEQVSQRDATISNLRQQLMDAQNHLNYSKKDQQLPQDPVSDAAKAGAAAADANGATAPGDKSNIVTWTAQHKGKR
jgi:hypothetical protein